MRVGSGGPNNFPGLKHRCPSHFTFLPSFGSTFGGLLYGIDKVPPLYQYISHASTGFWSNTGILAVVLRNKELPCNKLADSSTGSSDVGKDCEVNGNLILSAVGISEKWYLPTGGMIFLCCGIIFTILTTFLFIVKPWHQPLKIMDQKNQLEIIEENAREYDQEAIRKDVGIEFADIDNLVGSGSLGTLSSNSGIELTPVGEEIGYERDSSFSFGAKNPMRE